MSYILDAMRKSERDRTLGEVRTVAPEQRRGPGSALLVPGITVVFGLIGLAIWYGWGQISTLNNSVRDGGAETGVLVSAMAVWLAS